MLTRAAALIDRSTLATRWIDLLQPAALLALRIYLAEIFFRSGWLKLADWSATLALFADEYHVPLLPPVLAAVIGTGGELVFSALLILGLAGRIGALGLFLVNLMAVISYPQLMQFECTAAMGDHWFWGTLLALLVVFGPGKLSVDALLAARLCRTSRGAS